MFMKALGSLAGFNQYICIKQVYRLVQALISVQTLVFELTQLTCQKRFDCRNAIPRSSATLLGTSYSQIVVAVLP